MQRAHSVLERLSALRREPLDQLEYQGLDAVMQPHTPGGLSAMRICGVTRFWQDRPQLLCEAFDRVIQSVSVEGATIGLRLIGGPRGIGIDMICDAELIEALGSTCRALMPGMKLETVPAAFALADELPCGGLITGCPSIPEVQDGERFTASRLDQIVRGMAGRSFVLMFLATRIPAQIVGRLRTALFDEQAELSQRETESLNVQQTGALRTVQMTHYDVRHYQQALDRYDAALVGASSSGLWRVGGCYAAKREQEAESLRALVKAVYGDTTCDAFEPMRCICVTQGVSQLVQGPAVCCDQVQGLGQPTAPFSLLLSRAAAYPLQTVMSGQALAELMRLPAQEAPGYYIDPYVEFDSAVRIRPNCPLRIGDITQPGGGLPLYENPYAIERDDLCRHALVVGITGSGKTNTVKSMLGELWTTHQVPFMVIESAKREYWQLLRTVDEQGRPLYSGLRLFTLGDPYGDESIPYRINPFEVMGGISLQTHIDSLLATFKASFELYPPMPYVLESAVYEVYADQGWSVDTQDNILGRTSYPTLTDLYEKIDEVTDRMGYDAELRNNVKAALKARINSLRIGGKGLMMDIPASVHMGDLLKGPVVMELDGLGDDETKSFVMGILLVQLYEHVRSTRPDTKGELLHALVIEEAHRLLKRVEGRGESQGPQANAVNYFCDLLAEIRSYGEGILISDQIPTKLASDALKNTNLKLIHRTVMEEDRAAVGHAMNMTDDQVEYLSALPRGTVAAYAEGDSRPKLVRMPLVLQQRELLRSTALLRLKEEMEESIHQPTAQKRCEACRYCERQCMFSALVPAVLQRVGIDRYLDNLRKIGIAPGHLAELVECVVVDVHLRTDPEVRLCLLGYIVQRLKLDPTQQRRLIRAYIRLYADRLTKGVEQS